MGKDAFRAAKRRDPAVQDAIERGRAVEHDKLVGVLHDLAMGGQYVPAIFLLKARHGYREGDAFEANVNLGPAARDDLALNPREVPHGGEGMRPSQAQ